MDVLANLLALLDNNIFVKSTLLFVGGWLLARNPGLVKKAVPFLLACASLLTAALSAMFPAETLNAATSFNAHAIAFVASVDPVHVEKASPWWKSLLFDAIVPWLMSIGGHSGGKNTKEWIDRGAPLTR